MTASALNGQLPQYIGSTGGLLNSAETEEKYAITWNSASAQAFELPTGGAAMMNEGDNIMYFSRKEQCLALGTQLRTKFKPRIENYKIYRIFPGGDTEFLHPADGVSLRRSTKAAPWWVTTPVGSVRTSIQRTSNSAAATPTTAESQTLQCFLNTAEAGRMRACSILIAEPFARLLLLAPT